MPIHTTFPAPVWDRLSSHGIGVLTAFLKNEYPQTCAVILTRMDSFIAAQVMLALPESFALEVLMRIGRLESLRPPFLALLEEVLVEEMDHGRILTGDRQTGPAAARGFMEHMDPDGRERILAGVAERNRQYARYLRGETNEC